MKRLRNILGIICTVLMTVHLSFGQVSDAALTTQANVIRDETVAGANTKTRIAAMYQAIIDSKVSLIKFPAPSSIGTSLQQLRVVSGGGSLEWYTPAGAAVWGSISGLITDQSDLTAALNLKAALNSPTFTGVPAVPTASPGTNTTQAASTAFVTAAVSSGSVADGDKGDITVSSSGTVWSIDNLAVTNAKINDLALSKITGAGTGVLTALAINTGTAGSVILNGGNAGTPSALVGTNISGTASSLTAGNVTTNANLTGPITSVGNTTSITSSVAIPGSPTTTTQSPGTNNTTISTTAYVDAAAALKSNKNLAYNTQTGSYTLVLADADTKAVLMNITTTANNLTVPLNATVAFPIGTQITFIQIGTGITTVVATGGVTITPSAGTGNLYAACQGCPNVLIKTATDTWYLFNGTAPSTGAVLSKVDDTNVTLTLGGTPTSALLQSVSATLGWTGQLAVSRGGTGLSTIAQGSIIYGSATDVYSALAKNTTATRYLSNTGTTNNPAWAQINLANGVTGNLPTSQISGTTTNDNATAGNIGEEVNAIVSTYTNYSTTATYQNVTSITLTAGDWDISALMTYSSNAATITAAANAIFAISTTTASASGATEGKNIVYIPQSSLLGTSFFSDSISPYRVSISGSTTYYLNTQSSFTVGNPQYVGSIRARRIR